MPATNPASTDAQLHALLAAPRDGSPAVPAQIACKCCERAATLVGSVDFNKNCADPGSTRTVRSGIAVPYHRCTACGFLFTGAFDAFSIDDFRRHVYNTNYILVDPDYADRRPTMNAAVVNALLGDAKERISVLDYGGGNGLLERRLRGLGFDDVTTYDPFVPESSTRPDRRFNLILSFEVAEHTHRPIETFGDMAALLADDGMVMFSTVAQSEQTAREGLSWWYVAPRNGHVSLYTFDALAIVAQRNGLTFGSHDQNLHVMFRQVPSFARRLFGAPR